MSHSDSAISLGVTTNGYVESFCEANLKKPKSEFAI